MSTALAIPEWDDDKIALVKRTICKPKNRDATDDELALFVGQCRRTGLDPFSKQIYAIFRWSGAAQREVMTIQVSIDGLRLVADRTGAYAGSDDPVFALDESGHPTKATVTVWKMVQGQRVPFTRSARWDEYVQTDKNGKPTDFWTRMKFNQLGKCGEALTLRVAFPHETSGLYTGDEMAQADGGPRPAIAPQQAYADPPDNAEVVSYEQAEEIRGWMAATATDEPTYCKLVKVEAVDATPAMKYTSIIQSFQAKHARMQKEAKS